MKSGTIGDLSGPGGWQLAELLFDHVPDTVFFVKDHLGRYLAVNQTFVERCGLRSKQDITGKRAADIFPPDLAARYTTQDMAILRGGRPIHDRLEMHWRANRRSGWCLTTKIPLRDPDGHITGLAGISRDVGTPGDTKSIPASLAKALELLEEKSGDPVTPAVLAKHARLSPPRFARLVKRLFRLTPSQLITQTRLAAAARLLGQSELGIAEIAVECGFHDHSAFTRAFRSATGKTPTQFRGG
jgi:PAS domain S-box-containing protein